jgi:transposase
MKWHVISKVAKIVNVSRQAVYQRLKKLTLEEKISFGENLIEDKPKILLSDEGIKRLFDMTTADLDASRQHGHIGGNPSKLTPHQQQEIMHLVNTGQKTASDAARLFNVSPSLVSRLMHRGKAS